MTLLLPLLCCLALTILIEGFAALIAFRDLRTAYATVLCNLLTNPPLNLVLLLLIHDNAALYIPMLAALEAAAIVVEARILHRLTALSSQRALLASLLLNAVSFLAGLGLQAMLSI